MHSSRFLSVCFSSALALFLGACLLLTTGVSYAEGPEANGPSTALDLNGDGSVNILDVLLLLGCALGYNCPAPPNELESPNVNDMVRWNGEGWELVPWNDVSQTSGLEDASSAQDSINLGVADQIAGLQQSDANFTSQIATLQQEVLLLQQQVQTGLDECGVIGGDGMAEGACDCAGNVDLGCGCGELGPSGCDTVCGSTTEADLCGVCGGDGSSCPTSGIFDSASDCPTGTHAMGQWDGTYDCISPSITVCNEYDLGDDGSLNSSNYGSPCSYSYDANNIDGMCYGAEPGAQACVATCDLDYGCINPNSYCQPDGAIGSANTLYACVSSDTYSGEDPCPSGTHEINQGDGTYHCVPPDLIQCNGFDIQDDGSANLSNAGAACAYSYEGDSISGICFGSVAGAQACVAQCSPFADCENGNSMCQPDGAIGDIDTNYVCITGDTFSWEDTCPTGSHELVQGDGTYHCVPPSSIACESLSDLDACTYNWGPNTIDGTCYSGACVESCAVGADCENANSNCQAIGVIGAAETEYVCVTEDYCVDGDWEYCSGGSCSSNNCWRWCDPATNFFFPCVDIP